jgi:NAD(P)-dependent dehydrogenase (short-subunit alcohol dehydrogenase family)
VNAVLPGSVDSPFIRGVKSYTLNTPDTDVDIPDNYRRRVEVSPLGRVLGQIAAPEDIAHGILYLASEEARFVTGAALAIDGGGLAR